MFKKVIMIIGVIALTGWMGVANASLIFDFSWDSANGKVIGEIIGLEEIGGAQQASSIKILSVAGNVVGVETINPSSWDILSHQFYVNMSNIIDYDFDAITSNGDRLKMNFVERRRTFDYNGTVYNTEGSLNASRRVSVPEPGTVILLSLGLAGLSFARYRKQS